MKYKILPLLLSASLGFAQEKAADEPIAELDALTIESTPFGTKTSEITQAWSVLSGDELDKAKGATIADTLSKQPGVSQSFFGPSANRPMIRGLDKHRVRMLQNGTDTFDVSAQSEDHAVPIDPMFIDRVEILRGSSALLHGGSAIGGVVNMIDRSIPQKPYDSPFGVSLRSSYTSVNDGWNYGAMGYGSTDSLSFQINGFERDFKDYDAPGGFILPDGNASDKVLNSKGKNTTYGFGGASHWDGGFAGLSFSQYENTYGVPGGHASSETRLEIESDRFEARSEFEVSGSDWLKSIQLNFGYGDYKHVEIGKAHAHEEEEGHDDHGDEEEEEMKFMEHAKYLREGIEARVGFTHEIGPLKGVFGFHGLFDELAIEGDESIFAGDTNSSNTITYDKITKEDAQKLAFFLIEEFEMSEKTRINAGIRLEVFNRDLDTFKHDANVSGTNDLEDSTFCASTGFSHDLSEGWNLSSNVSYSERVPDTAELYSYGPHHATEAFEIGRPELDKETAVGIEVILRRTIGSVTGQISAFHTEFDNYIFSEATGSKQKVEGEEMPEMKYGAVDAEFQGLEAEIDWMALENEGWSLMLSAYGDMLRGKNKTESTHLPRIAPARLGVGLEIQKEKLRFGLDLTRVFKQDRIPVHEEEEEEEGHDEHGHEEHAHDETATPAYSLLNAYATYDLDIGNSDAQFFVRGYNLTDELGLNHTSPATIKPYAPIPGTNVEAGFKFDF